MKVIADLKNVREAKRQELQPSMCNMRTVILEVITDESIRRGQNEREMVEIVSSTRKRYADVLIHSFVRQWAQQVSMQHLVRWIHVVIGSQGIVATGCVNGPKEEE